MGGDPDHHHEQGEEQQRRAEVALVDHHDEGDEPGGDHRAQVLRVGEPQRADLPDAGGDELALVGEVGGEEDGQDDLGDLAGLEVDRSDPDPDAAAVDGLADARQQGEQQQADAEHGEGVAVALERAGALHQPERRHERHDPDGGPRGLVGREPLVEPGDDDVAEPVQHGRHRQQDRVGLGGEAPHGHVGAEQQGEDDDQERDDVGGDAGAGAQAGQHVGARGDDHHEQHQAQLGVATVRQRSAGHQPPAGVEAGATAGAGATVVDGGGTVVVVVVVWSRMFWT